MAHQGTKKLESTRLLILRPFRMDDAEAMFQNWANDPEVTKYLMWQPHKTIEVTKEILRDWLGHYTEPDFYLWRLP